MKKIAIFRRNGLGDLLTAYPLISYLKISYPSHFITLFVGDTNYPLVQFLPPVDEVVSLPTKGSKYFITLKEVLKKRHHNYDLALSAKTSPMKLMNFALFASGAKERRAYIDNRWHSRCINYPLIYNEKEAKEQHQALKCLHLIAPHLKEVPKELYPKIHVPSSLCEPYLEQFQYKEPTILIMATTTRNENRFDSTRYAKVLNQLYSKRKFRVALVSMKKDEVRAQLIAKQLEMPHHTYFTRSFNEFMALIKLSDFVFVGDGGAAHIAAALDKPQVVLFGQSNPKNWHPLSENTTVLYHPLHVNALSDETILKTLERQIDLLRN
jgi:ADP-heptose:LPS heptosyltransferase